LLTLSSNFRVIDFHTI